MLFLHFAPALFLAIILAGRPATPASITNGDFEEVQIGSPFFSTDPSDVPGWTHSGDVGGGFLWAIGYSDAGGSILTAGSGNQFVSMGGGFDAVGASSWSTSITGLSPGDSYLLDFMMADENTFIATPQEITVDFPSGSSSLPLTFAATLLPTSNYWTAWQDQETTLLATDTTATVRFTATTQFDVGLDDVQVTEIPNVVAEPDTLKVSICALLLLPAVSVFRWRAAGARRARAPDPRHNDPGNNVGNYAEQGQRPDRQHQPQDTHQRHVHCEVPRETRAYARDFLVFHRTSKPLQARRRRNSPAGQGAALAAEFVLLSELYAASGAEHGKSPPGIGTHPGVNLFHAPGRPSVTVLQATLFPKSRVFARPWPRADCPPAADAFDTPAMRTESPPWRPRRRHTRPR